MADFYLADIIGAAERGYASGKERRRSRTLSQHYMGATQGDQNALAQVYGVDPEAGMQAQTFGLQQRRAQRQEADDDIIRASKFYLQTKSPQAWSYLHQKFSSDSRFPPMPAQITTPEDQAGSEQFARALIDSMGGGGDGQNVQSRFINDRGEMVALMRDGSTRVVGKADPSMQIIEGEGGIFGVNRRNLSATPVTLGGAPQMPTQQPMPTQGTMESDIEQANRMAQNGVPAEQIDAWLASRGQQVPQSVPVSTPIPSAQLQAPKKSRPTFTQMSSDEIAAAGLPAGTSAQRNMETGQIEVINKGGVSTGGEKPMPTSALKMIQEETNAANAAQAINQNLSGQLRKIDSGKLDFGPVANLINQGRNFVGLSTEQSRNFQEFRSDLERLRNDSLRLNAGVQTDGDAQRAWNELFANINDREYVKQRLQTIMQLNQRAERLRRLNVDMIRENYGRGEGVAPASQPTPTGQPRRLKYNPQTKRIE